VLRGGVTGVRLLLGGVRLLGRVRLLLGGVRLLGRVRLLVGGVGLVRLGGGHLMLGLRVAVRGRLPVARYRPRVALGR
jgi:hypothetical protein